MRKTFLVAGILFIQHSMAQQKMSPELLWQLGRVGGETVLNDGTVIYGVSRYTLADNKSERNLFAVPLKGGTAKQLTQGAGSESGAQVMPNGRIAYSFKGQLWEMDKDGGNAVQKTQVEGGMQNIRISPKGTHILFSNEVKLEKISGADLYKDLPKSNAQVYTNLNYRHWDTWEDGKYNHVFYASYDPATGKVGEATDIMKGELFDCPQMPFGGAETLPGAPTVRRSFTSARKSTGRITPSAPIPTYTATTSPPAKRRICPKA